MARAFAAGARTENSKITAGVSGRGARASETVSSNRAAAKAEP